MIGDIAEGLADFGIGPFTSTPQRNDVVRFSIGNLDIVKTFFIKRSKSNALNLTLFIAPFTSRTWLAVICLILFVGFILFIIIQMVKDKQTVHFNLRRSLTFSFSGITFIRRWSVTPVSFRLGLSSSWFFTWGLLSRVCGRLPSHLSWQWRKKWFSIKILRTCWKLG